MACGNADLKPYSACQADVSRERYFSEQSIISMAAFYKRIENRITTRCYRRVTAGMAARST